MIEAAANRGVTLASLTLPHRRTPGWKYADLRAALNQAYDVVDTAPNIQGADVNVAELEADPADTSFAQIHQTLGPKLHAVTLDGQIGDGQTNDVHITFAPPTDGQATFQTILVVLKPGTQARVFEDYQKGHNGFLSTYVRYVVGQGASLTRVVRDAASEQATLASVDTILDQDARANTLFHMGGGRFARHDWRLQHMHLGSVADVRGTLMGQGQQHMNLLIQADHTHPGAETHELIKSIADDRSKLSFEGRVHVAKGADQTEANQAHHGLLLSETAEINAVPELEIFADDVICAHGATCGALDDMALFYAQSRGIAPEHARKMLTAAFAHEPFDGVNDDIQTWLGVAHDL